MPSILALPDELLCYLSEFVHPSCLLNLVLVNKKFLACSQTPLKRHEQLSKENRILSDRDPLTVPSTLRDIIRDPFVAWHIHDIEAWGLRQGWDHWRGWALGERRVAESGSETEEEAGKRTQIGRRYDYRHLDSSFYSESDLAQYHKVLNDVLLINTKPADDWIEKIRSGYDEPLKAMLFSLCPNLTKLTFMLYDTSNSSSPPKCHPLRLLCRSIRSLQSSTISCEQWPVGFQSLKEIVVGEFTSYWPAPERFNPSPRVIAPLFLLPNLERLHVALVRDDGDDGGISDESDQGSEDLEGSTSAGNSINPGGAAPPSSPFINNDAYVFEWGHKVSSVKELTFNICQIRFDTARSFIRACKGLDAFRPDREHQRNFEADIFEVLTEHTATLKFMEFFAHPLDRYRTIDLRLAQFEKLARLEMPVLHLLQYGKEKGYAGPSCGNRPASSPGSEAEIGCLREPVWLDLRKYLPASLEVLRIKGDPPWDGAMPDGMGLVQSLIDLVSGYSAVGQKYTQLRHICVAGVSCFPPEDGDDLEYSTLLRLCREGGVDLHGFHYMERSDMRKVCNICQPTEQYRV